MCRFDQTHLSEQQKLERLIKIILLKKKQQPICSCKGALMQNDCLIRMKHSSLHVKVPYSLYLKKKK